MSSIVSKEVRGKGKGSILTQSRNTRRSRRGKRERERERVALEKRKRIQMIQYRSLSRRICWRIKRGVVSHARSSVKKSFLAQIERCLPREAVLFTRLLRRGKIKIVVR